MLNTSARLGFDESHEQFRESVRRFLAKEAAPYLDKWEHEGITSAQFWRAAGEAGLLCTSMPDAYGGVEMLPTTFYIDRTGKITDHVLGLVSRKEIEDNAVRALNSKGDSPTSTASAPQPSKEQSQ